MLKNTTPKIDLDRLKQAMPIMDLAKSLGLEIRGRQARCYNSQAHAHGDRSFSLGLDTQRNRFKCFACGEQGSIIDLFMAVRGIELKEAINELAEMTGLTPMSQNTHQTGYNKPYAYKDVKTPPQEAINEDIGAYSEIYEEFYFYCIGLDQESGDYLKSRGLKQETLDRFLLFSVKDYQATDKHLKSKFSLDELNKAGIVGERGNLIFYKHKIIIPFLQDGRIVYLRGRYFDNGNAKPPDDGIKMLGLKGQTTKRLFNADRLTDLEKGNKVYIAEGEFDTMILDQHGYNAVGILGITNFNGNDIDLFKGLDVVLALDNDEAGQRATQEISEMFNLKGQGVSSKQLPDGIKDITDYFISL